MRTRRTGLWAAAIVAGALAGCGGTMSALRGEEETKFPMRISQEIPAAEGTVSVTPREDGQRVKLQVNHLAPADRVVSDARVYVVWLHPMTNGAPPLNVGTIRPGDDRRATIEFTTPFREFDVFITAERNVQATRPSRQQMMAASIRPTRTTY